MTRIIIATIVVAALSQAWVVSAHAYSVPDAVNSVIEDTHALPSSAVCKPLGGITMGTTGMSTKTLSLNQTRVCQPIVKYFATGRLLGSSIDALATIGHEAAHLRGVWNERVAECAGVRFAYSWLRTNGAFKEYVAAGVKSWLLNDVARPAEYKLRGTCTVN